MSETFCPRCGALAPDEDALVRHLLREHTLAGASEQFAEAVRELFRLTVESLPPLRWLVRRLGLI